jgi:hypothetical protein
MKKIMGLGIGVLGAMLLLACKDKAEVAPLHGEQGSAGVDAVQQAPAAPQMVDVIETSPSQIVGISYPHDASVPAGLVKVLQEYADQARAELQSALDELGNDKPRVPYELSLSFTVSADTPQLMAVSADGSRYTGGAHGQPLVARFVWLKQEGRLLPIEELIAQPASRTAIAGYVQEQLVAQMENRLRADHLPEPEQAEMRRSARQMINEGTEPDAQNFSQYLPVIHRQGPIEGLRFVFPPYQVGPYSDGTQSVEVPLDVLLPHLEPKYRALFSS